MHKRRKPLKDCSLKHLKRIAFEETQNEIDLILESSTSSSSSISSFESPITYFEDNSHDSHTKVNTIASHLQKNHEIGHVDIYSETNTSCHKLENSQFFD